MQEVERELLHHHSPGGPVSCLALAVATANLNARIRSRGLSAREIWTQRDQFSNQKLPLQDQDIIMRQHERIANHLHSEKSKAPEPRAKSQPADRLALGDLIYLYSDRSKSRALDRYLVVEITGSFCNVRKFVGSQLRSTSYRMKKAEFYRVASEVTHFHPPAFQDNAGSSSDETSPTKLVSPPMPIPLIQSTISTPDIQEDPDQDDFTATCQEQPSFLPDSGATHTSDTDSDGFPLPRRSNFCRSHRYSWLGSRSVWFCKLLRL